MHAFLIMNAKKEFYGPGGWLLDPQNATPFSADDALKMLKAFPKCGAIRAQLTSYKAEDIRQSPRFVAGAGVAA